VSRFPLVSRILGAGCGSAFLGLLALSAMASAVIKADASELPTLLLVACLAGDGAAGMYRGFVHPSLTTSHKGLDVRNPFSHTLVPWEQMDRLVPDSNGLVIVRHRLPTVRVWVIQKSQWSIARNREVRADRIARHLAARWLESTGAPEQHLATEGQRPTMSRAARWSILLGTATLVAGSRLEAGCATERDRGLKSWFGADLSERLGVVLAWPTGPNVPGAVTPSTLVSSGDPTPTNAETTQPVPGPAHARTCRCALHHTGSCWRRWRS